MVACDLEHKFNESLRSVQKYQGRSYEKERTLGLKVIGERVTSMST